MKRTMMLALALIAALTAISPAPTASAQDCYWYCDCEGVKCSCGYFRNCPWPPPPIACPTCP